MGPPLPKRRSLAADSPWIATTESSEISASATKLATARSQIRSKSANRAIPAGTPKTPPDYTIEVTGITDATTPQGAKEVLFSLSNEAAQGSVRYFIIAGGTGTAVFRKFDDGWRVETAKFQKSTDGVALSETEQQALTAEATAEATRRAEIYKQATVGTSNEVFECHSSFPDGRPVFERAFVTNVGVEMYEKSHARDGFVPILYKDVGGVSIENFYGRKLRLHGKRGGYLFQGYKNCDNIDAVRNAIQTNLTAWKQKWNGVDLSVD